GGGGEEGFAGLVGDDLDVHVPIASKYGEPRPLVGATHATADPIATALPRFPARCRHQRAPAAAFPAFRRMVSVPYLTPLPLYGSGGRSRRIAAAVWPSSSRAPPSSGITTRRSTLALMPPGS